MQEAAPQFAKPSLREVAGSLPFFMRMIWEADRRSAAVLGLLALIRLPLSIATVQGMALLVGAIASGSASGMWTGAAILAGAEFANAVRNTLTQSRGDRLRFAAEVASQERALEHTARLPFATLEDPNFQRYATAYDRYGWVITNLTEQLPRIFGNLLSLAGYASAFFLVPWPAAAAMIGAFVLKIALLRKVSEAQWQIADMETREGRRAVYYQSTVLGASALPSRLIDVTDRFLVAWRRIIRTLLGKRLESVHLYARATFFSSAMEAAGFSLGLWFIIGNIGAIGVGAAAAFITAFRQASEALDTIVGNVDWFMQYTHNFPLIRRFYEAPEEKDRGAPLPPGPLRLEFEDVWFRYPGTERDILRGVSFTLEPGEDVALVGLNGAGKSTLLKLIMGIYAPTKGRILANGRDITEIKPSAWRQAAAMLPQDMPAYDDTVKEQVLYGHPEGKMRRNRFAAALGASGLAELTKGLPKGLLTHAGRKYAMPEDQPIELSGGQRQIVSIARTLYRDAKLYIFDEPTSAVDAEKEERFFESLPEALEGRTAIFVAHRFSTIRRAKRIMVMDAGRVIEDGGHDELLATEGRYAELFALQARLYR